MCVPTLNLTSDLVIEMLIYRFHHVLQLTRAADANAATKSTEIVTCEISVVRRHSLLVYREFEFDI